MYRKIAHAEVKLDKTLGYEYFMDKDHPLASKTGRVYYHRHVASIKVGRWLSTDEHVHHIDGDRANNDRANLEVLSQSEHAKCHFDESDFGHNRVSVIRQCAYCGAGIHIRTSRRRDRDEVYCNPEHQAKGRQKIDWPDVKALKQRVDKASYVQVARELGVSDNAVRKRIKNYDNGT